MKKRKALKKLALFTLLFVLTLLPTSAQAASQKTKALKAYKKFLNKSTVTLAGQTCQMSDAEFAVAYIDNNSVPELFLRANYKYGNNKFSIIALYTYKNGKMKRLYVRDIKLLGSYANSYSYYKKRGIISMKFGHGDYASTTYYKISGNKLVQKLSSSGTYDWQKDKTIYSYSSGASAKKITKSKFNKQLKTLTKSKKATALTLYKNTAANKTNHLK